MNISLIMFKTGSMAPTIPAGSVALVREIPASQIEVGEIVTVDREGKMPVTHRVMSVEGSGDTRTITMKGDANELEDPLPYTVSKVRIVLASVPELANVIVWFSRPVVLGGITIASAALVTWAFWPRAEGKRHKRRRTGNDAAALVVLIAATGIAVIAPVAPTQAASGDAIGTKLDSSAAFMPTSTDIEWMLWLGLGALATGLVLSRFVAHRKRPSKNGRTRWRAPVAMLGIIGLVVVPSLLRPEPTVAAWADPEVAQGVFVADTLSIGGIRCTTERGWLNNPIGARLDWSVEPSTMVASSYRVEVIIGGASRTMYVGANPTFTFEDGLNLLGLLQAKTTLTVHIYATYITPNGTNWTTPEPGIAYVNYDPGLLLAHFYRCPQ